MGTATSREAAVLLGRAVGSLDNAPTAPAFFEEDRMTRYNVLNERDYYPRKNLPDLNPCYGDRKVVVNQRLAEVYALSPSSVAARSWIGAAACELDNPLRDEAVLFADAARELSRLSGEARR